MKDDEILKIIKENMLINETIISKDACKSKDAIRLTPDPTDLDIRPVFFKDIDRIIHSLAYTRYIDKTQVYSFIKNDHITHRVLHVQLVSKIARTIGRALLLNEDLIEAIALSHDLGHTPFGHKGEYFLNKICENENIGYFCHNAQSVRVLKDIENINISVQSMDGMLSHNGEILLNTYSPFKDKTSQDFLNELDNVFNLKDYSKKISPMTLEGCVVRISDIIAYIGRDIEDAIIVGSIKRKDIPNNIFETLGNTNSKIVNNLILDLIKNSYGKNYLEFSTEVFNALIELKNWNYNTIYNSTESNLNSDKLEELFNKLFKFYLEKLKRIDITNKRYILEEVKNSDLELFEYLSNRTDTYLKNTDLKRIVIDYIAGQTDNFFINECKLYVDNDLSFVYEKR